MFNHLPFFIAAKKAEKNTKADYQQRLNN